MVSKTISTQKFFLLGVLCASASVIPYLAYIDNIPLNQAILIGLGVICIEGLAGLAKFK